MNIFNSDFADFIICLTKHQVQYMLVGGYAVILRGYSRSTGDIDVWVNKTEANFNNLKKAIAEFGLPLSAIPGEKFFSDYFDVFTFGKPPYAIEVLTALKGLASFEEAFLMATIEVVDGIDVRVIHLQHLIKAKEASGRHRDLNDIDNLPSYNE